MESRERKLYELHAQTCEFSRRIENSERIILAAFDEMQSPYISVSWGKDSTVMAHLMLGYKLPMMYVNCGEWDEWPDTPRVKREFCKRFNVDIIELQAQSIVQAYLEAGMYIQDEENTPDARHAQHDYSKSLGEALDKEALAHGFDGSFIGIRKEESDNRQRLFAMRGALYFAKTRGLWACHPLMHWTGRDVWAYTVKHDLPYNELYDLDPRGRELARNGAMFGTRSARYGRLVFLKKMYPDWFNRFAEKFPEVRRYV